MAAEQTPGLDEAWESFFASLRRARGRYARTHEEDGTGLSLSQYVLLLPLLEQPHPVGELATLADIAAPTATRALDALVARGLVVREPSPHDRRCVVVSLTPEGAKVVRARRANMRRKRAKLLAELDDAEREQTRDLLVRLADLMDSV